jgi:hypothetical protein
VSNLEKKGDHRPTVPISYAATWTHTHVIMSWISSIYLYLYNYIDIYRYRISSNNLQSCICTCSPIDKAARVLYLLKKVFGVYIFRKYKYLDLSGIMFITWYEMIYEQILTKRLHPWTMWRWVQRYVNKNRKTPTITTSFGHCIGDPRNLHGFTDSQLEFPSHPKKIEVRKFFASTAQLAQLAWHQKLVCLKFRSFKSHGLKPHFPWFSHRLEV